MTLRAPAVDPGGDRLPHQTALGGLPGRKALGQYGATGQRGDCGLAKAELRAGINPDLDHADARRSIQRGNIRGLAPVELDRHHGGVMALGIERPHQTAIFGPGGGKHLFGLVFVIRQGQQGRGPAQGASQRRVRAGNHELHAIQRMTGLTCQQQRRRKAGRKGQTKPGMSAL